MGLIIRPVAIILALLTGGSIALSCDFDRLRHSIVYIYFDVTDPENGAVSSVRGTGLVVSRNGYVLTASHLFRDWSKQGESEKERNPIRATLWDKVDYVSTPPLKLEVVNSGNPDSEDVALLKLPDPQQPDGYSPPLMCHGKAKVGEDIFALGFPWGSSFQVVRGQLGTQNAPGGRLAAASNFAAGMSGGPVYNSSCSLIGLVKGGLANTQAVQWITPINHAASLLGMAGVIEECRGVNPIAPFKTTIQPGISPFTTETIQLVVLKVIDSKTGDPVANAFVSIVAIKSGAKIENGITDKDGELPFPFNTQRLRIVIKNRKQLEMRATLSLTNSDRRIIMSMTRQCLR